MRASCSGTPEYLNNATGKEMFGALATQHRSKYTRFNDSRHNGQDAKYQEFGG